MKTLSFLLSTFALAVVIVVVYSNSRPTVESVPAVPTITVPDVAVEAEEIVSPYHSFQPPVQESITGTREENNKVLWNHIASSSNAFYIDDYDYVKVYLHEELACNRDILMGINGKSVGVLHKNNACSFMSNVAEGDFSVWKFPVDSIEVIGNGEKRIINLRDYITEEGVVNLSFAVGQTENYVVLIEIE